MCPARLLLLPADAPPVDPSLRVIHVYAPPELSEAGARLAAPLGVRLTLVPALGADPAEDLRSIADQHRGETVIVLGVEVDVEPPVTIDHTGDAWTVLVEDAEADVSRAGDDRGKVGDREAAGAASTNGGSANEVTLQTYEQAADRFRASLRAEANKVLIDLVADHVPAGAQILEIGSGTGRDALELERRGFRVRRTDAAGSFIAMLRMDGKEADPLNALTDDLGGPYDLVFADAVFLHFDADELAAVLTKAHRAAPLLAFSTREGEGSEWSTRHLDLPRHFTLWQEAPLRELLARTGWSVVELRRTESTIGHWFQILAGRRG